MKKMITMSLVGALALTGLQAASNAELEARIADLENKLEKTDKTLKDVKIHDAFDNIKFGIDFRNAIDVLDYKDNETGETASNNSLLTSRLYLTMAAAPMKGLIFKGKLAIYSTWGAHIYDESMGLKDWSVSSKASDTVMRVKEAYFVYSTDVGEQPVSLSIGRRPASNGFLANYRENESEPGSPLAHITNMEVNAVMVRLGWDRFVSGAYTKFVYGRAHSGDTSGVYSLDDAPTNPWGPNAKLDSDDENVDFFLALGDAYNDGQY